MGNQLQLKNRVLFGAGERMTFGDSSIMGLPSRHDDPDETSIFHAAVAEGLMDNPVFTTYLTKCAEAECADGGVITFGDEDRLHCQPVAKWVPVVPRTSHWQFAVDGLAVNGEFIPVSVDGVSDTGTSHLVVPPIVYYRIMRMLKVCSLGGSCAGGSSGGASSLRAGIF